MSKADHQKTIPIAQLLDILDSIDAYFYSIDDNWNLVYVSKCVADDFGIKREDLLDKNFWKTFPRFVGTEVEKNFRAVMEKREMRVFEWKTIYVKNQFREFTVYPSANGITVYGNDVTKRKEAESALQFSNERMSEILNTTEDFFYSIDFSWNFRYVSKAVASLIGKKPSDLIGKNAWDCFPRLNGTDFENNALTAMEKREIMRFETQGVYADKIYAITIYPVKTGIIISGIDITELKEAEEELAKSKQRLADILNSLDDYVFSLDRNWNTIYASNRAVSTIGAKPEEVIGKCFWDFGKVFIGTVVETNFREAMTKREVKNFEWKRILAAGYSEFTVFPSNEGITVYGKDITERKKLQQQLEEYARNLEKLVEERSKQLQEKERLAAIGETAGMVGHDIRNPLQAIVSELYMAKQAMQKDSMGSQEAVESIDFVQEQIDYITKIVQDLQDYARPLKPEFQEVELSNLLVDVFSTVRIPEAIVLEINIKGTFKITTDPTFLKRALTNLANNAVQSMPDGGKLIINIYEKEVIIVMTFADTGVGIPDDIKPLIFKPLVTTKAKGQGLGLAVVKRLVEALGGKVSFESQAGKGTTFMIELPKVPPT